MLRFLLVVLIAWPALACTCQASFSACNEVRTSSLVFIGTVQAIEPSTPSVRSFNQIYASAQENPPADALARLKEAYLKLFPGLTQDERRQLQTANTQPAVIAMFNAALDRGIRVRLKVRSLFKHEDDDDAAKKDDDRKDHQETFEVWTPFDDCGFDFQAGETYLVYANNEEGSDYFFTDKCTRTQRVSDAGDDLAFLFFYKDQRTESARLEGFVTNERQTQLDFNQPQAVKSPVVDVVVQLQSERLTRYARSDGRGRFLFDGLPKGNYEVSALAGDDPLHRQLLAGPYKIQIADGSCVRQLLFFPRIHKE